MPTRVLLLLIICMTASCGGGDKYLPSSNQPEYDPKKVYTAPPAAPNPLSIPLDKPAGLAVSSVKPSVMDPAALRKALEAAARARALFEKVESLDSSARPMPCLRPC